MPTAKVMSSLIFTILFFIVALAVPAQTRVDLTFNAVPSNALTSPSALQQVVQPDGKVIVFGIKGVVDGVAKADIFRLNAEGTLDNSFSYCGCGLSGVTSLKLTADGRIVVAGGENSNAKMIRLNSDGSLDGAFVVNSAGPPPFLGGAQFIVDAIQPDGKVFATLQYSSMGYVSFTLYRYNSNGTVDAGFPSIPLAGGSPMSAVVRIALLADGRFYLAVTSGVMGTGATLRRRNSDGSIDGTWETPTFSTPGSFPAVSIGGLAIAADGSLLVSGSWTTVNGIEKRHLVRLQPAGNVDLNFNPPNVQAGYGVHILPDGKILFSGRIDISGTSQIFRLGTDGTVDPGFVQDSSVTNILNRWVVDSIDRIIFLGSTTTGVRLVRLLPNGGLDASFNPNVGTYGQIYATAVQSDGKVLMAGAFSQMNGVMRSSFARVNADGSLDATFNAGTGFSSPPDAMVIQSDGKVLAVGPFNTYNGTSVNGLVRINTDGSIDNSFGASTSSNPKGIALQADGMIVIVGSFSSVNGTTRTGIARLNPLDGSLDNTFNPIIGSPSLRAVHAQSDGKVMIGGSFSGVNGFNRSNLARLSGDGSLDQSFTATSVSSVASISRQADGKYVITTGSNPTAIARRNTDGSPDSGFTPPTFSLSFSSDVYLHTVLIQPDGTILVGGRFDTVGSSTRRYITRLAPNGTLDLLFMPAGADARVRTIAPYSAGKVIAGGELTVIGGVSKSGNARLDIATFRVKTPFDFNGDGRADFTVYRPSSGVWYELYSNGDPYGSPTFGLAGDIPAPADFDGDGVTDEAIFRPSSGDWWYWSSITGGHVNVRWGASGDLARPSDFDGDGKADFVLFRPSNHTWYRLASGGGTYLPFDFGLAGDQPLVGDFDGDGKSDMAIFRPSSGDWWYAASSASNAFRSVHWGANGDIPVPADYDGDGKTDYAVFRPSNGGWYITHSSDLSYVIFGFGLNGDRPVSADYDGDGKADAAVFRPSTGVWYVMQSTSGTTGVQWGISTDVAVPNAFLP